MQRLGPTLYCSSVKNITNVAIMTTGYSIDDLLGFLEHVADRGLMPTATARSLAVATRNVFGVLNDDERGDVRTLDLDAVIRRFQNKRARDFTPDSLKEYERRVRRAVQSFTAWRDDPANFRPKTRVTAAGRRRSTSGVPAGQAVSEPEPSGESPIAPGQDATEGGYQTAFPLRANHVVTLSNVPTDLSAAEADRLAQFVRMLVTEQPRLRSRLK
ncbi:MAG: hypothetical protein ACREON_05415 [Gemmatimonadaceae bacterium]